MRRSPILVGLWVVWAVGMIAVFVLAAGYITMLGGIVLSIATYRRLRDRTETGRLSMRWRAPYRIGIGGIIAIAVLGMAVTARGAALDARAGLNAVFASIFVVTAMCGWRALVTPTPRRVAGIPLAFHMALVVGTAIMDQFDLRGRWGSIAPIYPLSMLLVASALAGALALVAFVGDAQLPQAAIQRSGP